MSTITRYPLKVTISLAEYNELLKDRNRLNFLEAAHTALNARYGTNYGWNLIINDNVVRFMAGHSDPGNRYPGIDLQDAQGGNAKLGTCREAIDKHLPHHA